MFSEKEVASSLISGKENHKLDGKFIEIKECHQKGTKSKYKSKQEKKEKRKPFRRDSPIQFLFLDQSPFAQMTFDIKNAKFNHSLQNLKLKKRENKGIKINRN